jgi:hypothetical protein
MSKTIPTPAVFANRLAAFPQKAAKMSDSPTVIGRKKQYGDRHAKAADWIPANVQQLLIRFEQNQVLSVPALERLLACFPERQLEILPRLNEAKEKRTQRLASQVKKREERRYRDRQRTAEAKGQLRKQK